MSEFNKFRWNDHPVRVGLKHTASALATAMFNRAEMDGTRVYGSQERLAEELGVSDKSVRRAQQELQRLGLIDMVGKRGSGRSGRSSEWRLTMPSNTGHEGLGIPDINTGHEPSGIPDTELNTGHPCPEYRTSVAGIPDTGVPPIDPLLDPGNKPGSVLGEPDTRGVRPIDPFAEEDIADVPQRDVSTPLASQRLGLTEEHDTQAEPVPVSSQPTNPLGS